MKTDIYIEILRYGRDKLNTGFNTFELTEYLKKKNLSLFPPVETQSSHTPFIYIICSSFQTWDGNKPFSEDVREGRDVYFIKPEALANLINYEMLQETQRAVKLTKRALIAAIIIGLISIAVNIFH